MSKNYDFNKARAIIAEHKDKGLVSAHLGMQEDWSWTAETIYEDGKCTLPDTDTGDIAGISGSHWATPCIELRFTDGTEDVLDCYQDDTVSEPASAEEIAQMKLFAAATGGMDSVK